MQSQLQCPVCTLYLHVGMNLQVHLDTHPKEQVIRALVNLTLTQQQNNDTDSIANSFKCTQYAPIPDDPVISDNSFLVPQAYYNSSTQLQAIEPPPIHPHVQEPIRQPPQQHQQLMILKSCSTSVYRNENATHQQSTAAQQFISNKIPISAVVPGHNMPTTSTRIPTKSMHNLPPPPPYGSNVVHIRQQTEQQQALQQLQQLQQTSRLPNPQHIILNCAPPEQYQHIQHQQQTQQLQQQQLQRPQQRQQQQLQQQHQQQPPPQQPPPQYSRPQRQYYYQSGEQNNQVNQISPSPTPQPTLRYNNRNFASENVNNLSDNYDDFQEVSGEDVENNNNQCSELNIMVDEHLQELDQETEGCLLTNGEENQNEEMEEFEEQQSNEENENQLNDENNGGGVEGGGMSESDNQNEEHLVQPQPVRPASVIHINDSYSDDQPAQQPPQTIPLQQKKLTEGLRVLSNVKLESNKILDVSCLGRRLSDAINLSDVFTRRSIDMPFTVIDTVSNKQSEAANKPLEAEEIVEEPERLTQTAEETSTEEQNTDSIRNVIVKVEGPQACSSKTIENLDKLPSELTINSDLMVATASTSRAATSVIRLASPKKSSPSEPSVSRAPLLKTPFVKAPKKLVVKFKKPFVPVVEEDANLQPPIVVDTVDLDSSLSEFKNEEQLDINCSEIDKTEVFKHEVDINDYPFDTPFSPLRQSYTPPILLENIVDESEEEKIKTDFEVVNLFNAENPEPSTSLIDEIVVESIIEKEDEQITEHTYVITEVNMEIDEYMSSTENNVSKPDETPAVVSELLCPSAKTNSTNIKIESWSQHLANDELNAMKETDSKANIELTTDIYSASTSIASTSSSSSSHPASTSQSNNFITAGPSRLDYGLSSLLGYNDPVDGDDFYTGVRLSPIGFTQENYNWNQRFSPQYAPYEGTEKNSYMDLDLCKNTNSYDERAPSTDSLNIRTDEKMPAKGEISEQESNGDIDGSWSHQIYPLQDTLPRYTSSYDTTVARESWSLSNDQNLSHNNMENIISTILPKFTPLESTYPETDIKPSTEDLLIPKVEKTKTLKPRKYRCPECPLVFSVLKEKRSHLIVVHDYQRPVHKKHNVTCTTTSASGSLSTVTSTITSNCSTAIENAELDAKKTIKQEPRETQTSMTRYLLSYNWNILRQKLTSEVKGEEVKLPILPIESNVYLCMVCKERFYSIKSYDQHMSIHPGECYTCGRLFKHWLNLSVHLKRHLNMREYGCIQCSKKFVLRQNLLEHMYTHSGETPLQCKVCSKRFRRYSNLIQHRNRHHLKIRPKEMDYICSCGEVFHSQAKIAWHRETHDKKPKCCPYCRERFIHKNSLSRHIRLSHTDRFTTFKNTSVECPVCKQKYMKSSLKAHMAIHSKMEKFECSICNKGFTTKWNLKQHKWIHASRSSKPFKCIMCTKAFIREAEFTSHMNTHKSIKPYTCDHCGCQFARKYNLLRHTREHETPKRHRCDDCGKVFHRAYYLTEHRRSHTGERPFECIICGKTSTTKTNHNKHVKIHHARDPLTAEG